MIPQLENRIVSSFMLLIDHQLQEVGQAYSNYSGQLYPVASDIAGLSAYATPFKQLCNDTSISGATIMSGVYLNNTFVTVGQSGLKYINHYKGAVYFTGVLPAGTTVTSSYGIKEFSVELANQPEWELMAKRKYYQKNQFYQNLSGLSLSAKTTPIVYVVHKAQENKPFAFGGHCNDNRLALRCVILAENEFQNIGAASILKNLFNRYVPITTSVPFDSMGNSTGTPYNYHRLSFDSGNPYPWIWTARGVDIKQKGDFEDLIQNMSMVDFDITTITGP